jgi:hypothetical protein
LGVRWWNLPACLMFLFTLNIIDSGSLF